MANTIKRTVNISYQAEGLEKIQQEAQKIELFSGETKTLDALGKRIESLQASMAKQAPEGIVSPELAAEFGKEYNAILATFKKARIELIALQDKESALALESLDAQIEANEKLIEQKEKLIQKAEKEIQITSEGKFEAGTKVLRKEVLGEAKETALGPEGEMQGLSGRDIKNVTSFLESMESIRNILTNDLDPGYAAIIDKLEKGKTLNEEELALLEKAKTEHKVIGLNAEEVVQQFQNRRKILEEEQRILKERRAENLAVLNTDKAILEAQQKTLEVKRDQIETTLADPGFGDNKEKIDLFNSSLETATDLTVEHKQQTDAVRKSQQAKTGSTKESTKAVKENTSTLARATKQVFNYGVAFTALRRIYRETLRTITDLDKALTEMAIVTTMNRKETWELVGTMQQLAKETGFTTTEIAKLSTVYFRQGRTLSEVIELTRVAAQAARVAGISAGQSADFLTSAINAFQLSADQALGVSDRFASLASQSASSYEELALGLSKFAAQANVAGISIDFAMGLLAKGVETTREAPETIGTALKTVIARMRELTDLGKTFEDGMDINRVEVALRQVGVALRDSSGQFRDMESVLTDVGMRWETLNANQQASIAVSLAGTRQQSRLIAIMSGFDRTLELVNISQNSAGATMAQHTQFMQGMEAATVGLQTAYQKFITTITDSELIIGIIRGLSTGIEAVANGLEAIGFSGQTALLAIIGLAAAFKTYSLVQKNSMLINKLVFAWKLKTVGIQKIEADLTKYQTRLEKKGLTEKAKKIALTKVDAIQSVINAKAKIAEAAAENKKTLMGMFSVAFTKKKIILDKMENKGIIGKIFLLAKLAISTFIATVATKGFTAAVLASPLAPFALAILGVVAAFVLLRKGFKDNEEGVASFAGSITAFLKIIWIAIKGLISAFGSLFKALKPVFAIALAITFAPFVLSALKLKAAFVLLIPILDGITGVLNIIGVIIVNTKNVLKELIEEIKEFALSIPVVGTVIETVGGVISSVVEGFSGFMNGLREFREETERELLIISNTYEDLAERFTANTQTMQGELFNLRRSSRTLDDFLQRLSDLQATGDEEGIEKLINDIKDIDEELVAFDGGTINFDKTAENLKVAQEENLEETRKNFRGIYDEARILMQKDFDQFVKDTSGELSGAIEFFLFEEEQRRSLDKNLKELTDAQNDAFRKYVRETAIQTRGFFNTFNDQIIEREQKAIDDFLNIVQAFDTELSEISSNLNSTESRFSRSIAGYRSSLSSLGNDQIAIASFQQIHTGFSRIVSLFGDDAERFADIFDTIGFEGDRFDTLAIAAEEANVPIQSLFESIQNTLERLDNVPEQLRMTTAIAEVAKTTENAALAMTLFGSATEKTVLEIAQSADLLRSRIKRLADEQQKFLSGDISDQDLFELIENYRDFFADEKFFNDFVQGRDLSIRLLEDEIEVQYEYQRQLILTRAELERRMSMEADADANTIQSLRSEEARLMLLTRYRGTLANVTREQNEFNQTLKAYNNLVDLGFKNIGLQTRVVEALRQSAGSTLVQIQTEIQSITQTLASRGIDETIVQIVDGVAILQEGFSDLDSTTQQFVERLLVGLEDQLTAMREFYSVLASESIALEKELADQKIKVYQDYFAALDRLEEQRRRAVSREDLVSQLARLEGATDERSRKRAIELRRQLNQVDEDTSKKAQEASRASMIATINEGVEQLQQAFESAWMEFINSAGDAGENMGEELFSILQRYGLVGADQKFDLGELLVKADDSFSIPDPTTELAEIAEEAEKLEVAINNLNGVITSLDGKIAALDVAIANATDSEVKKELEAQKAELVAQKKAAEGQLEELKNTAHGLKAQHAELEKTATRLGLGQTDGALAAAKNITDLQAAIDKKDFTPEIDFQPIVNVTVPAPVTEPTPPVSSEREFPTIPGRRGGDQSILDKRNAARREYEAWYQENQRSNLFGQVFPPDQRDQLAKRQELLAKYGIDSFRQGGMIDYNGLAMLHGSRSAPEAVLTAEQTQMFMGLRDALSNISLDGEAGSSINIEEIIIKTDSLNNNQDFNRAGEALAEAFQGAINRRGVTINTKR